MWSYWCYDGLHGSVSERVLDFFLGGGGGASSLYRATSFVSTLYDRHMYAF